VPRPVLVIREIEQLARRAKWRTCDLAEALGVSVAMLNRLRAGTHAPSREVLGAILRTFGANAHVRDLVLHFLEHELAQARIGRLEAPKDDALAALDPKTRSGIQAFVRDFLRRSLTSGAGLRVVGEDAGVLRGVVGSVRAALDEQGVSSVVIAGNAAIAPSLRESALAAPLLIVERVDYASESVRALIAARAAVRKPVFTTATDANHAVPADAPTATPSIPSPPSDATT
jgi:transcriptional regulator with XRE-family HTH domain